MRIRILPPLLAAGLALVVAAPAAADGWAEPERLSAPGTTQGSGDGVLTAAWETVVAWKELTADRFGTLRAHAREAGAGGTTVDLATNVDLHDLAAGSGGTVAAAWVTLPGAPADYAFGHVEVAVRPAHGDFGAPVRLGSGNWGDVAVAVNAGGDVAVAWAFEADLFVAVRPAGGSWTTKLVPGAQRQEDFDVALTPDGAAIVAWGQGDGSGTYGDLDVATLRTDGTFSPTEVYSAVVQHVRVLADDHGGAAVVWGDDNARVVFREADGGFGPFQHVLVARYGGRRFSEPAITPDGELLILQDGQSFPDQDPGLYLVRASTADRTVSAPVKLSGEELVVNARIALRPDGAGLLAWTDYDHAVTRVRHADGTLGPERTVTCTAPSGADPVPLGLDAAGRGVLALAQHRYVVHEPGWLLTREDPAREALDGCPPLGAVTITPTPTPPGPVVIDVSNTADRRFSASWWRFDLDDDGTYETLTHDGVVETTVSETRTIRYRQCGGPVFDDERACGDRSVWVYVQDPNVPPPIPPAEWLATHPDPAPEAAGPPPPGTPLPDPPPPAERFDGPALGVTAPTTARLAPALRRGVPVTVRVRRAARVRIELRSRAYGLAGRRTIDVAAGAPRTVNVALRRRFARRVRRVGRMALRLRVTGAGVAHETTLVLRR
jgi:hypothetical protein